MPEMPDVIPDEPVEDEWGNKIRDRTLQRYTSISQRNSLNPSPTPGEISYLGDSGVVEVYHSGLWRSQVPTGVILPFAGITPPTGYLICNGAVISRTTYAGLYAVIANTYGAGDGSTTFAIPDLRQRFPMGMAASGAGSALGQKGGSIDHAHSINPPNINTTDDSHSHSTDLPAGTTGATATTAVGQEGTGPTFEYVLKAHTHSINFGAQGSTADVHHHAVDIGAFNSDADNPPYIALHFVIRT